MAPSSLPDGDAPGEVAAMASGWSKEEDVASVPGLQGLSLRSFNHGAHGTKAVLAHVGGPLCSVAMFFATEARDDKGLVHCLEHLCFMGSQKHPKGYLDFLATRCGCEGTNAYTEADHTCFEFEAAGQVGLLAVLPVFVEHVLCPALTDDAFTTEIHHVNGKGERQGVVFSEMLGRVTDEEEMLDLERRRAVFGDVSPYSYEHGGLPDLILKLTKAEIADYHRHVYTTDNLFVVVSGTFDDDTVLAALGGALDSAVSGSGARQRCERRPFLERLPALPPSCPRRRTVTFPSDDISLGTVAYSHRLDGIAFNDIYLLVALDCLGRYLEGLASSPLEQAFVQCDPPVATGVTCNFDDTAEPHFTIELSGVPFRASPEEQRAVKKMGGGNEDDEDGEDDNETTGEEAEKEDGGEEQEDEEEEEEEEDVDENDDGPDWFSGDVLLQRLVDALRRVRHALQAGEEEAFKELQRAIKKESVTRRVDFEDGPSEVVRQSILSSMIFARYPGAASQGGALEPFAAEAAALEELATKPSEWWADLLDKQLLRPLEATLAGADDAAAEVRACPSAIMCLKNERKEEHEAKKNAKALGKKKLKALQERVDAAEEANRSGLDEEMQASFPPPVTPGCVPDFQWEMERIDPPKEGGVEVLEVEVSSGFVELSISWHLGDVVEFGGREGAELRAYLNLFSSLLCETDVAGQSYRSVVARLDDELVSYSASVGCGSELLQGAGTQIPHPVQFGLKLSSELDKTANMVAWADRLAHECEFPEEKVLSTCKRIIAGIKARMRDGESVLTTVLTTMLHETLSPQVQLCSLEQRPFLERCVSDVAGTCAALRRLRDIITAPSTAVLAVISGNTRESRCATRSMLQEAFCARHASVRPSLLEAVRWGVGARPSAPPLLPLRYLVVGCAGADTANVHLRADLPMPPLALDVTKSGALRLLCEALTMMEGALAMAVRGKGLAYGASVSFLPTENAVSLELWECTNVQKAVDAALEVLRDAAECDALAPFQLDNARGALVFSLKGKRATPTSVVSAAVGSACRGWRTAAEVLEWENGIGSVTDEDVLAVHEEYLKLLCDASKVRACVVCDPGDCKKTAKGLAGALGLNVKQVFVKDNIADCYEIVDSKVRDAYGQLCA